MVNKDRGSRRSGAYARRKGSRFLLSGLACCARCGALLYGQSSGKHRLPSGKIRSPWDYYLCANRKNHQGCAMPRIGARALEQAVIAYLFERILTPENLAQQIAMFHETLDSERPVIEAQLIALQRDLTACAEAIERLLIAIETSAVSRTLTQRLQQREIEREDLTSRIQALQKQMTAPVEIIDVAVIRSELRVHLDDGDVAKARQFLSSFIDRIEVSPKTLRVQYKLPFE